MSAPSLLRRPAVLLFLGLCAIAAVTTLLGTLTRHSAGDAKPSALPNTDGVVAYPAFSPDGNRLVYSQRGVLKDDVFHLFIRRLPTGAPAEITQGAGNDISPVWSADGASIAFLRLDNGRSQCMMIPANGGEERKIAEFPTADASQSLPRLAWAHDGKKLVAVTAGENQSAALSTIDVATGAVTRVTKPADGTEGDWAPAVSPDGLQLAFQRSGATDGSDLYACDLNGGNLRRITFSDHVIRGIAWMPNGKDLIYATSLSDGLKLWRIAVNGGSPHNLFLRGKATAYPAISLKRERLVYTDSPSVVGVWRAPLDASAAIGRPLLRSSGREFAPSYSADGRRVADLSDQSGANQIWASDSEGGNRVQITSFKGEQPGRPTWSPDGKWLLFDLRDEGRVEIYKTLAQPGSKPVRVLPAGSGASWSHDGKSIYFQQRGGIWKASADGGNQVQIVEEGGGPFESTDGKFIYFRNRRAIWRTPSAGGAAEQIFEPEFGILSGAMQVARQGIYYQEYDRNDRAVRVSFFDFASKRTSVAFRVRTHDFSVPVSFAISPDSKDILYPKVDQSETNLMLVENFR